MNCINGTDDSYGAFDFTTNGLLNDAFATGEYWCPRDASGKLKGTLSWWQAMSVTITDNHEGTISCLGHSYIYRRLRLVAGEDVGDEFHRPCLWRRRLWPNK